MTHKGRGTRSAILALSGLEVVPRILPTTVIGNHSSARSREERTSNIKLEYTEMTQRSRCLTKLDFPGHVKSQNYGVFMANAYRPVSVSHTNRAGLKQSLPDK
ncbi:hypothetical protein BDN70DRAFT_691837 [Pholiota conissans]|uniref:Uncharacterized protein n=1 Tax=Pholiota conissans TaxID=109636 RepID=A0A9P6D0I5_9AGAR|nr:hypothetical protein BDN70DRAFT_691837 [Pholiota conissans]